MAIDSSLKTGKQHKPSVDPIDRRRRWPFPDLQPGDWFTFDAANLNSVRSCAQFHAKRHGCSFSVGKEPDSPRACVCVRIV